MTQDPTRAENMHLRAQLTSLQRQHAALARERDELSALQARTAARLDVVTQSSTWRVALHLVGAAELIPAPLRHAVGAGLRRLRSRQPAPPPPPSPAPPPAPTIPSFAQSYGVFTQDDASLAATPWYDAATPDISVIILNWNRSAMTLACIRYVLRHTAGFRFEIIVADNGSKPDELAILQNTALPLQILPLGSNLFFGEANNLAAEQARGQYLFLLNNDAFVHDGWLPPLVQALQAVPRAAAAGSQLRYPDGTLQEAGSLISPDGVANQIGKNENPADERFGSLRLVDYVSAAAMLIRRADFLAVLGFDLCYEPAYYEDVDLCMKLRARGNSVVYCPDSIVTHVENVTSLDNRLPLQLDKIIHTSRVTFVARWREFLLGHPPPCLPVLPPHHAAPSGRPQIALHSPAMLMPGGRERTLLAIGQALADIADVTLVGAVPCSTLRLRRLGLDLGLDVSRIALAPPAFRGSRPAFERSPPGSAPSPPPAFDLAFVLGNAAPPGLARRTIALGRSPLPIPPVQLRRPGPKARRILAVGRFVAGPHGNQQHQMVQALQHLVADGTAVELHLAGWLRPEPQHRAYYLAVVQAAKGLPIVVHPNLSPTALDELYSSSMVYWHLAGPDPGLEPGPNPALPHQPAPAHLGIAVIEAMSAGCVPVAFGQPTAHAPIANGQDGVLVDSLPTLVARTRELLDNPARRQPMADRAIQTAARFNQAAFTRAIQDLASAELARP